MIPKLWDSSDPKAGFSGIYVQQPKLLVHTFPHSRDTLSQTNTHG